MKGMVLLFLTAGAAYSLVVGYHVEPKTAGQSGWTQAHVPNNQIVSQVLTADVDELDSASAT